MVSTPQQWKGVCLFSKTSRLALELTCLFQAVPQSHSPWVKWSGYGVDHSCLVLRLRMCCIILLFPNIPSWCLSTESLHFTLYVYVKKFCLFPVPFLCLLNICNCFGTCVECIHIFTFILNTASVKLSLSIHIQMNDFFCNRIIIIGTPIFPRSYTDCHNITTVK